MTKKIKWEDCFRVLKWIIRAIVVITMIIFFIQKQYKLEGFLVLTLVLTYFDTLLEKIGKIKLSLFLRTGILLFILGALYLGSLMRWYDRIEWWDILMHALSGVLFTYLGMTLMREINDKTTKANIHPAIYLLFGFCFTLAIGVVWEITEFSADKLVGANMQRTLGKVGQNAILDTMTDLISALIASAVTILYEGIRSKNKHKQLVERIGEQQKNEN